MKAISQSPPRSLSLSCCAPRPEGIRGAEFPGVMCNRDARLGVSLLEVLISIFVILVGLLGVVALIPIGHHSMLQATKADRAAACGRAALREIRVRRMLDSTRWRWGATQLPWNPGAGFLPRVVEQTAPPQPDVDPDRLDNRVSYCIDPLYIARNSQGSGASFQVAADVRKFPYLSVDEWTNDPDWLPFLDYPAAGEQIWMPRVTVLPPGTSTNNATVQQAVFDRIVRWQDDKLFSDFDDRERRPEAVTGLDGIQFDGNYSWMATIVPIPGVADSSPNIQRTSLLTSVPVFVAANKRIFEVSVVVFYKRDFSSPADRNIEKPSERLAVASILSGGDIQLKVPTTTSASYLDVKKDDWLMLCGWDVDGTRNVHKWYRIVAVGEEVDIDNTDPSNPWWIRNVTLAGPDWNPAWCVNLDGGSPPFDDAQAVLVDNVAGVYTEVMQWDRP